ncbi:MAG: helix-turn-helix transcriptional regulator, partial [Coriobacteriales bacterium]|nr:helix-turn-helix transcriptional regulator [Coriobacteriales bacterium]
HYLHVLAQDVDSNNRGTTFGCAYAASTVFSWLFSLPNNGALLHGMPALALCAILAIPAAFLVSRPGTTHTSESDDANRDDKTPDHRIALLACGTVLLASLVKNAGYSFPIADLNNGVGLEQLRLLYGLGLCAAGFVSDKGRPYGLLCCMTALVTPFLMLSLQGMDASSALLWAVDYLLFGFFTVFRVLIIVDIASDAKKGYLAGAGMFFGRIGDALGTALCLVLAFAPLVLVCVTSALFALTTAAFFLLYQRLYANPPMAEPEPEPEPELSEQEVFDRFATLHDLSMREQEVLQLVLDKKSNSQIASELYVSESTVKFHVRNLLRKTGCKNRLEVMRLYSELRDS